MGVASGCGEQKVGALAGLATCLDMRHRVNC